MFILNVLAGKITLFADTTIGKVKLDTSGDGVATEAAIQVLIRWDLAQDIQNSVLRPNCGLAAYRPSHISRLAAIYNEADVVAQAATFITNPVAEALYRTMRNHIGGNPLSRV